MTASANDPWAFSVDTDGRSAAPPYPAPSQARADRDLPERDDPRRRREKVRSGPLGVKLPWFLPWFDADQTIHENQVMRQAYRRHRSARP
jgi:hypothetical protein